jgi:hypothetical protein
MLSFHQAILELFNKDENSFAISILHLNTDNGRLTSFAKALESLQTSIEIGNIEATKKNVEAFQIHLNFLKSLLSLQKRFPNFFKENISDYNYNFSYKQGILTVGSTFGTFHDLRKNMLYYSRLLRDAEVRTRKHPKHTTIVA